MILIPLTYGHSKFAIQLFQCGNRCPPLNEAVGAVLKLAWKFSPKNSDHLCKMPPKSRADESRCSNLPKGKEVVSVIVFHDAPYSVRRIELLQYCPEEPRGICRCHCRHFPRAVVHRGARGSLSISSPPKKALPTDHYLLKSQSAAAPIGCAFDGVTNLFLNPSGG
jgi:hypothetical protein